MNYYVIARVPRNFEPVVLYGPMDKEQALEECKGLINVMVVTERFLRTLKAHNSERAASGIG